MLSSALWAVLLVLLTDAGWAAWFAWRVDVDAELTWRDASRIASSSIDWSHGTVGDLAVVWEVHRCWTHYGTIFEYGEGPAQRYVYQTNRGTFESVAPGWLERVALGLIPKTQDSDEPQLPIVARFVEVGWPMRLLWVGRVKDHERGEVRFLPYSSLHLVDRDSMQRAFSKVIPLGPIWPGQLATAGGWFGLICMVRLSRQSLRCWRGRCGVCGYDLRGNVSGVCPECGAAAASEVRTECAASGESDQEHA